MTLELERLVSSETVKRLQEKAENQKTTIESLLAELITDYAAQPQTAEDFEDTPDDVVVENFRRGWQQIKRGESIDADESIARIKAKYGR